MTPLSAEDVEAIATRVAELLGDPVPSARIGLIDVKETARRLGVKPSWVYEHAEELGVIRLGSGRRPRLRFDMRLVEHARKSGDPATAEQPRSSRARVRRHARAPLLEVRG